MELRYDPESQLPAIKPLKDVSIQYLKANASRTSAIKMLEKFLFKDYLKGKMKDTHLPILSLITRRVEGH